MAVIQKENFTSVLEREAGLEPEQNHDSPQDVFQNAEPRVSEVNESCQEQGIPWEAEKG